MHYWRVAGGLITDHRGILLVANRRRSGSIDWSTPGGVIDAGESELEGLTREVDEETGLLVSEWGRALWTVSVDFVDSEMDLVATVYPALAITGTVQVDDPDGVVVDADYCLGPLRDERLSSGPQWASEPMREWLDGPWASGESQLFKYRVRGRSPLDFTVERLSP